MTVPDVVIAGAPKCGTTALAAALDSHPDFHLGPIKEPRFFANMTPDCVGPMSSGFNQTMLVDLDAYLANFSGANGARTIDASTDYLSSPGAAARIADRNPNARIVVGLRSPVARGWSEHLHLLRNDAEPLGFLEALQAEDERIRGGWMPLFHHVRRSLYADGIGEFIEAFGRDAVFIYRHEDLRAQPDRIMADLGRFLTATSPVQMVGDFNVGGAPRSAMLNKAMRSEGGFMQTLRHGVSSLLPERVKSRVRSAVDSINLDRSHEIEPAAHEWIVQRVADDLSRVERLTGLDLSAWLAPAEA